MKELTVIDEKGIYIIKGKTTIGTLINRFGKEKARELLKKYLKPLNLNNGK